MRKLKKPKVKLKTIDLSKVTTEATGKSQVLFRSICQQFKEIEDTNIDLGFKKQLKRFFTLSKNQAILTVKLLDSEVMPMKEHMDKAIALSQATYKANINKCTIGFDAMPDNLILLFTLITTQAYALNEILITQGDTIIDRYKKPIKKFVNNWFNFIEFL